MAHLTLAGRSKDGKRLLLVDDRGTEHTLDIDAPLKAAVRGETTRLGQLEIQMESTLRPRDIQARIRAGESPEAVAQAAQTTVDRIMVYAGPVMDERAHVAQRAQASSVRRKSGDTGARTLGEAVAAQLRAVNVDPDSVEWDAWRREDGRWTLSGAFTAGRRKGAATFSYDMRGNFVTLDDDDARWLVGDQPAEVQAPSGDDLERARRRRLSAVSGDDTDELPLGEDAIELVSPEAPRAVQPEADRTGGEGPSAAETTLDLGEAAGLGAEQPVEAFLDDDEPPREEKAEEARPSEPPARRPARKTRGRASVPSWDEIMFGGPGESGHS